MISVFNSVFHVELIQSVETTFVNLLNTHLNEGAFVVSWLHGDLKIKILILSSVVEDERDKGVVVEEEDRVQPTSACMALSFEDEEEKMIVKKYPKIKILLRIHDGSPRDLLSIIQDAWKKSCC